MEERITVDRVQTGVRMEKQLVKVLKGLAEYHELSLGDLLEGIVLHAFENKPPFSQASLEAIRKLKDLYGLRFGAEASHKFQEGAAVPALRVVRSGTISLAGPGERVFPLFTPEGERHWVDGWDPIYVYPSSGAMEEGAVFLTREQGQPETVWSVVHYDPEGMKVVYHRVTAGHQAATVEVECQSLSDSLTRARVTYRLTGLSPEGNERAARFTEEHYRQFLAKWEEDINRYLL